MPSYKWDFNSCAFRDGFCKSSHIYVCMYVCMHVLPDINHMDKLFMHHKHCDDVINMKFGFQTGKRMNYQLVKTRSL